MNDKALLHEASHSPAIDENRAGISDLSPKGAHRAESSVQPLPQPLEAEHTTGGSPRTPSALWQTFLDSASSKVSSYILETWLKPLRCARYDGRSVSIEVRDEFTRDWLVDHYRDLLLGGLREASGNDELSIEWLINPKLREAEPSTDIVPTPAENAEAKSKANKRSPSDFDAPNCARPLNKRYLFENFVCGPSNQFAMAASRAVAERPGRAYNPLFLYGRVGLGKTHLLCAVGHAIRQDNPNAQIVYMSAEDFTNEVVNAVLGNKLDAFRNRYRYACDVLLIDDIQLIAGRERTQHEFFHIFNALYDSERQIVVTSDKLPHEIPDIEERLRNRFQFGLIADIQTPETETRVAIVRRKAREEGIPLTDEVAFFLAEHIHSNVRELEGALVRVMAHASLTGAPITVDYARQVLGAVIAAGPRSLSVEHIQETVATFYGVELTALRGKRRLKQLVKPRQVAMYLARKHTDASFPELGRRFEKKDHTTVMSACTKIKKALSADPALEQEIRLIEQRIGVSPQAHS